MAIQELLHPLREEAMDWETSFDEYLEHLCNAIGHSARRAGLVGYCQGLMLPIARKSVGSVKNLGVIGLSV